MDNVNICPQCESEYLATVRECADCHTPLISKQAYLSAFEPLPFSEDLVEVRTETASWVKNLAVLLSRAGIPSHIRLVGSTPGDPLGGYPSIYRYTLYVLPEHAALAQEFELKVMGKVQVVEEAGTETGCPACGAARLQDTEECSECGLYLGEMAG